MTPPSRLRSLDVFRGLTVAAMIVVNSPGRDEVYRFAAHAPWHGMTPADLVFPAFLVILGAAAALAKSRGATAGRALKRAAGLFALGVLVNVIIGGAPDGFRLLGVLQRIALCSVGVWAALSLGDRRALPAAAAALLALHWLALERFAAPGFAPGDLTPEGNVSYWLDRVLLEGHLGERWGDLEGVLSTAPALATALIGACAGRLLARRGKAALPELGAWGLALLAAGLAWSRFLPLNKHLWTGSYALTAAGASLAAFAACAALVEGRRAGWTSSVEALGRHALAAYVLSGLAYDLQEFLGVKLKTTQALFGFLPPRAASLAYAIAMAAAALAVANVLQRVHGARGRLEPSYRRRKEAL